MAVVNVAQWYVDVEASKKPDNTVLSKEKDESQLVDDFAFFGLPPELQCHILEQTSYAHIREVKTVSKQLKHLIERHWKRVFFILPPKIQIKILSETHMNAADMRRMKLVSKDMRYLIERGGQHLTKQNVSNLNIYEFVPGVYKFTAANMRWKEAVSFGDFSRIFAHCHFNSIFINEVNVTLDFCDQLQRLRENKITCEMLVFGSCNFNDEEILTSVDRLLGATYANHLCILEHRSRNVSFEKEFFRMPSVRKLKELILSGECDFSDDDLSLTDYKILCLERCRISEYALRRFHEELLDCRREIYAFEVKLQDKIDVDRLLSALPNIERIGERQWNLRNIRGGIMEIRIENAIAIFNRRMKSIPSL